MAYAVTDRPAWTEVVGIVLACAVLLVLLVRLDRAAYDRAMADARKAIAAQRAERAPVNRPRAPAPAHQPAPRTESLGDRGPIVLPVGGAWSAGTVATVPHVARRAESPTGALRRITGPVVPDDVAAVSDAAQSTSRTRASAEPAATATPASAAVRPAASARPERSTTTVLVALFAGLGVALVATGGVLIGRGR